MQHTLQKDFVRKKTTITFGVLTKRQNEGFERLPGVTRTLDWPTDGQWRADPLRVGVLQHGHLTRLTHQEIIE